MAQTPILAKPTSSPSAEIDLTNLSNEFVEINARISYANQLLADAEEFLEHAEAELTLVEAQAFLRHRESLKASGEKVTEKLLEALVVTDPQRIQAMGAALAARANKQRCRREVDSFVKKSEILVSLGAHIRAEMNLDPTLRTKR